MLLAVSVALTAWLPACGFHLRGAVELPPVLHETYIDSRNPYTGMARALRNELQAAGATIMEDRDKASAILRVVSERSENRILSVGSTGRATEYELFEEVTFSVSDSEDNVIIEPQTVRMIRDREWKYVHRYPYGPHELYHLAEDPEERVNLVETPADAPAVRARIEELKARMEAWFVRYTDPALDGTHEAVYGKGQLGLAGPAGKGEKTFADDWFYLRDAMKEQGQ